MKSMAEVLAEHQELAWNHKTGQAICGECDAALGPFTADIEEQARWLISHQADALTAAGYGPVKAVLALADEWESKYGPGTRKEEVFGPQKVSIKFAVKSIRTAIENALNP